MQLVGAPTDSVGGPFGPVDHFTKLAAPMIILRFNLFFSRTCVFLGVDGITETDISQ